MIPSPNSKRRRFYDRYLSAAGSVPVIVVVTNEFFDLDLLQFRFELFRFRDRLVMVMDVMNQERDVNDVLFAKQTKNRSIIACR